jgi:predicted membrane-bound dolichyl-phosphate-mannose-protein mannosyltransferase
VVFRDGKRRAKQAIGIVLWVNLFGWTAIWEAKRRGNTRNSCSKNKWPKNLKAFTLGCEGNCAPAEKGAKGPGKEAGSC